MIVTCPSCELGQLTVCCQTFSTFGAEPAVGVPTTDDFVSAECNNPDCHTVLTQDPGDGRLRRADLRDADTDAIIDDDELYVKWIDAVTQLIEAG